ncbi:efflux RND transporter periplasmic adaptor subunit [Magnetovirga frankeli]|uniref:efflux RND transporter periplasmic adaptor subunit n=1 Tax=Magnetovirga frankeli TaxID=947516 RepID=UPI00129382E0|nr:efflux RND transporter periplasmic adaptor subunit [gamma proteobacterium SS-5]
MNMPISVVLLMLSLLLVGCGDGGPAPSESRLSAALDSTEEHARKHLDPKYVCPMHPQIVRDEPGNCPICGMDLVPKQPDQDQQQDKYPAVTVGSAVVQNMGLRTAEVRRGRLWKYIESLGRVEYDETRISHLHPRVSGWLERLHLRSEGDPVKKGQLLAELYSPEILSAEVDFRVALGPNIPTERLEKARNRLRLLGVDEATIGALEQGSANLNRVPIQATQDGIVARLGVREGMYVQPSVEMMSLVDTSSIWVQVDVFEQQLAWVRPGLSAEIRVPAYPDRVWQGQVDYLYPELDPKTRTLRVRLRFDNPEGLLKAKMFAEAVIYGGPEDDLLLLPAEAVISTGKRTSVIKQLEDGRFQPVDVVLGMQAKGQVAVLEGLSEGDRVVTSGQFLIDSESNLQASFSRLGGEPPSHHGGH